MKKTTVLTVLLLLWPLMNVYGAYHHGGDTDSEKVLQLYPEIAGTKLDSCALCHTGGAYERRPGRMIDMGSCQWCHLSYGYDGAGNIEDTLNDYGLAYLQEGKDIAALQEIASHDSDGDTYPNDDEILALRYPGDAEDDPTKVPAPFKVVDIEEMKHLNYHSQLMLMNTHKSGDFYAEYGGVVMADLLEYAGIDVSAEGIIVYAPDGFSQYHPLETDPDPLMYPVNGIYPQATYFFDPEADSQEENGWCDYTSPALEGVQSGDDIIVPGGLQLLLAYTRDGKNLEPGQLGEENKLNGEGPFRVVPPQKIVGPPDQSVKSDDQDVIWPFDENADHNAGFATRSATIIRVDPLPEGTTEINILEAGWDYVDDGKVVIYGAIDPLETLLGKLTDLLQRIKKTDRQLYRDRYFKKQFKRYVRLLKKQLKQDRLLQARMLLRYLSSKFDGCSYGTEADWNDWIMDCEMQRSFYWSLHEITVLVQE